MAKPNATSPRALANLAVARIEGDNAFTDIVLSHLLESSNLSERDRAFVTDVVRGTIRWKKRLDWIVDQLFSGTKNNMPREVRWLLWQALYQIEFTHVPPFAAVNETINLARANKLFRWTGVMNGILRTFLRAPQQIKFPDPQADSVSHIAVTQSHPEWLVQRWIHQFGLESTNGLCRANNEPPVLSVRVHTPKISCGDFEKLLVENKVEFETSLVPGFYRILSIGFDVRSQWLNDGLMTIQDESAGLPGLLASPTAGQIVADLCAAPGGKSTHMAELMRDQGLVVSGDINPRRANLVKQAAGRLGLKIVHPIAADAHFFPVHQADVVLLDAPCSGLGVIRKKPDVRWKKNPQDVAGLQELQRLLLEDAAQLVRARGTLVYSTCTIDPQENEFIVETFLQSHPQFELAAIDNSVIAPQFITDSGYVRTWPHTHRMDGSFAAKMIKRI